MKPIARMDGLTTRKFGNELVVYDTRNQGSVHLLNRVAETVWRSCDGRTDVVALARIVGRAMGIADARPAVELALEQLSRRGLLETPVERADPDRRRDRRQALKQLAACLAIPTVLTVTATKARADSSCAFKCANGKSVMGTVRSGTCFDTFGGCITTSLVVSCSGQANGTVCVSGVCCGNNCVNPASFQTDPANCGSCGNVCQTFQTCVNGQCQGQG